VLRCCVPDARSDVLVCDGCCWVIDERERDGGGIGLDLKDTTDQPNGNRH